MENRYLSFLKAKDHKNIELMYYNRGVHSEIILNIDGTLRMTIGEYGSSSWSNEIFSGTWTIDNDNKFIMKAIVSDRDGPHLAVLSNMPMPENKYDSRAGILHILKVN